MLGIFLNISHSLLFEKVDDQSIIFDGKNQYGQVKIQVGNVETQETNYLQLFNEIV